MAKKVKVTAEKIMKAMGLKDDESTILTLGEGEDTVDVTVKTRLTLQEMAGLVNDVLSMVFIDIGNGEVVYQPAFERFAINYCIVSYMTDIELPKDTNKANAFIEKTDIIAKIVDPYYAMTIDTAVEYAINYKKEQILKRSKFDDIIGNIQEVISVVKEKTESLDMEQILTYVQDNAPELKDKLENLLRGDLDNMAAD